MEGLLVKNCLLFFNEPSRLTRMIDIVDRKSPLSLRMLDHAIVNWAREKQVYFWQSKGGSKQQSVIESKVYFDIHNAYKNMLTFYTKKYFDPFRRHCHMDLSVVDSETGHDEIFKTTIGQLCFFKWLIEEGILDYIESHLDDIKTYMNKIETDSSGQKVKRNKQKHKHKHEHLTSFILTN